MTNPNLNYGRPLPPAEYRFKKGQINNPKGRPARILTTKEKLSLLSKAARSNIEKANAVEAIREMNRMQGVYPDVPSVAVQINFIKGGKLKEVTDAIQGQIEAEGSSQEGGKEA